MTANASFEPPELELASWRETRDALQLTARMLGAIRRASTPAQKHWWHASLAVAARGLTTRPIPSHGKTFEMLLDLISQEVAVTTSHGPASSVPLAATSTAGLWNALVAELRRMKLAAVSDPGNLDDRSWQLDLGAVRRFWTALAWIETVFQRFKGELREETSPVQLWPHHFDLAFSWFSGHLVPGEDPDDESFADEQLTFGFSTGDATIPNAYFYVTAYPLPDELPTIELPASAYWNRSGFQGAVLPYEALRTSLDPGESLLGFLRSVYRSGRELMGD